MYQHSTAVQINLPTRSVLQKCVKDNSQAEWPAFLGWRPCGSAPKNGIRQSSLKLAGSGPLGLYFSGAKFRLVLGREIIWIAGEILATYLPEPRHQS